MGLDFLIELPLIDEDGQDRGHLSRFIARKPKYLPRVGDCIFILPEISPRVKEVKFSGLSYSFIHLILEPIPVSYRHELENDRFKKGKYKWRWSITGE